MGNTHVRWSRIAPTVAAIALALAACGGSDDESSATTEAAATTAASAPVTTGASTSSTTASSGASDTTVAATTTEATDVAASTTVVPAGDDAPETLADREAEFHFATTFGVNSFDPHLGPTGASDTAWTRPVYDTLLTPIHTPDGMGLGPRLATAYEVTADGLDVRFELREGVTFQDGTAFNAEAVKANIERAQGPDSTVASFLTSIESVEVVDPSHVVFHLAKPDPGVVWAMAIGSTGMMVSPAAFDTDLAATPVGSGPFKLVSAQKDGDVVYERWPDHWNPDAALVSRLVVSTVSDGNARYNGLRSGEYDSANITSPLDVEARSLEADGYHYDQALSYVSFGVLMNSALAPLDDVRVRRAISMAIDRDAISERLTNGINPPAVQPFNDGVVGHDPTLEVPYDVEAARQLVIDAGAEGASITIVQQTTAPQDAMALVVQQALSDIGLNAEIVPFSPTEARPTWREGAYHAFVAPIAGRPDPGLLLAVSYFGPDNPAEPPADLVAMADAALVLPLGSDERAAAYKEISAYLVENPIHTPIVQFSTVFVSRPNVVGSDRLMVGEISTLDFRGVGITG